MNCEELRPDYLLYAMGTMAEPEIGEMRAHLARGCQTCTEGLRQAHALAYSMGAVVPGPEAPRELRSRVLAIAGAELAAGPRLVPKTRETPLRIPFWAWSVAAACLLLALAPGILLYRQLAESRGRQEAAMARLHTAEQSTVDLRTQVARLERGAAPIFALELERGGSGPVKQLTIPAATPAIVLALPTDVAREASTAQVVDAAGEKIWSVSPLPSGDADSTGLSIPSRLLPAGRYTVVLLAGDRTVAKVDFQVAWK